MNRGKPIVRLLQEEAKAKGEITFFTGRPCRKHGHISPRYTSSYACIECHQLARKPNRKKKEVVPRKLKNESPRKRAMRLGEQYYTTGKPCKNGHTDFRQTCNSVCKQCGIDAAQRDRRKRGIMPRKFTVPRPRKSYYKKKVPSIKIYKEVRITEEEIKAETFDEMTKRIYAEDRKW